MAVANLPEKVAENALTEDQERLREALADKIFDGMSAAQIARRVHPDNRRARLNLRARILRMARTDPDFQRRVAERAAGELVFGLGPAVQALNRSAGRGRIDAVKLLFESSGFHNPKVSHEHSGEIKVKLEIPRPKFDAEIQATDADVVSP